MGRTLHISPAFSVTFCFLFALSSAVRAQPVISTPPTPELVPPSLRPPAAPAPVPTPRTSAPAVARRSGTGSPFSLGPISVHPFFTDRFLYSDGLQFLPGRKANSYINTLTPGFRVDVGENWTFDYAATWTLYTNDEFNESLDHAVNFAGRLVHGGWAAQFSQGYATATTPRIETGRQTEQESVSTRLGVTKVFDRRFSMQSSVAQNLQFISTAPDNYSWTTDHSLQYRHSSRLSLGVGASVGYVDMDPGVNMAFVNPHAQVTWTPSEKLTFSAQGGEDIRQVYSRGVPVRYTPVFNVAGTYRMFQYTSVGLTAARTVSPSVQRNQVNDSTTWGATFSQRLLQHFNFSANYGETDSGYAAVNERVTGGRRDKSYNYGLRLGTTFLRRGSIALFYQGTHNSSNTAGYGIDSTQMGVEVGFRY